MILNIVKALVGFSIMIFIHELGHFIACKITGTRVEQFSIGFVPIIKKKIGETEYCIGAIPLGGYVRPAGGDLSSEDEDATGAPDEFLSKNFWQKTLILAAGPFMNVLMGVFVFWLIPFAIGISDYAPDNRIGNLEKGYPARTSILQTGDRIIAIDGQPTNDWYEIITVISENKAGDTFSFTIQRGEDTFQLELKPKLDKEQDRYRIGISQFIEPVIGKLQKDSPAYKAGLREKDRIIKLNGNNVDSYPIIKSSSETISMTVLRENKEFKFTITPEEVRQLNSSGEFEKNFTYGLTIYLPRTKKNFLGSLKYSLEMTGLSFMLIFKSLQMIGQKLSNARQLGGPIVISYILYETSKSGWADLLNLIGLLSINLAFVNLFPLIIITDGGQITIFAIEAIKGKPLSANARARLNFIGFCLIASLMLFVIVNDIFRFLK